MLYVDIEKEFKDFNLKVNFTFDGDTMGLLGPSGSGKSITLKCIAGIVKPDRGMIVLNDRVLFDSKKGINIEPQKRNVGYLFQDYALFPNMTVYQNIGVGLKKGHSEDKIKAKIKEMRLTEVQNKYPYQISGGECQRVALGRILINEPEIILLDEPFSALDEYLRWEIEKEVVDILSTYETPTILVSHNRNEVYRMCDKVSILQDGRSEKMEDKKVLFTNPKTYTGALITGCKNFSKIKMVEDKLMAADWNMELSNVEKGDLVGVRSHNIKVLDTYKKGSHAAVIEDIVEDLFNYILTVRTKGAKKTIRIDIDKNNRHYKIEDVVYISIDAKDIMVLRG